MPFFFERFPRVLITETSSYVRIFGALRWGVIYLHILYSDFKHQLALVVIHLLPCLSRALALVPLFDLVGAKGD